MITLYNNHVMTSTITAFSENPYYAWDTALKDTKLSRAGRTLDDSAQWLKFDLGSAKEVTHVIINAHNLTSGATVVLEGNATDVWTSPTVSETLTIDDVIYKAFTGGTLRYWRITIDDASNPDTYIEIGSVFLGTAATMPGFDTDGSVFKNSSSTSSMSLSRQLFGQTRIKYKVASINFPVITQTEKGVMETFIETVDTTTPFYFILWENDIDIEAPVYMRFDEYPEIVKRTGGGLLYSTKFKLSEVF